MSPSLLLRAKSLNPVIKKAAIIIISPPALSLDPKSQTLTPISYYLRPFFSSSSLSSNPIPRNNNIFSHHQSHMKKKSSEEEEKMNSSNPDTKKTNLEEDEKKMNGFSPETKKTNLEEAEKKNTPPATDGKFYFDEKDLESEETLRNLYQRWHSHWKIPTKCSPERKQKKFEAFKKTALHVHEANKKNDGVKYQLFRFADRIPSEKPPPPPPCGQCWGEFFHSIQDLKVLKDDRESGIRWVEMTTTYKGMCSDCWFAIHHQCGPFSITSGTEDENGNFLVTTLHIIHPRKKDNKIKEAEDPNNN